MGRSLSIIEFRKTNTGGKLALSFSNRTFLKLPLASHRNIPFRISSRRCTKTTRAVRIAAHIPTTPGLMLQETFEVDCTPSIDITSSSHNVPAILAGGYNIQSYADLDPLIMDPFSIQDTFLAIRPSLSPFKSHATYNTTITKKSGHFTRGLQKKRLNYKFIRGADLSVQQGHSKAGFWAMCQCVKRVLQRAKRVRTSEYGHPIIWEFGLMWILYKIGIEGFVN
jgi:hypothetical protein